MFHDLGDHNQLDLVLSSLINHVEDIFCIPLNVILCRSGPAIRTTGVGKLDSVSQPNGINDCPFPRNDQDNGSLPNDMCYSKTASRFDTSYEIEVLRPFL